MRPVVFLWASALSFGEAFTPPRRRQRRDDTRDTIFSETKKFIVEVEAGVALTELSRKVEAAGAKVLKSFDSEIFSGLSVETESENLDTLQAVAEVAHAWPVKAYKLPPLIPLASFSNDATAQNWSVHHSTGVDELHRKGILGKGVKVAVIDSGVDYRHPALGGGYGSGFKVSGGYDLVGEEYDGSNEKVPDEDPLDTLGHGTHVAGIIAGKSDFFAGVAPEAELLAFKVFGAFEGTDEDTLIDATIMAYESGADIITASIGRAAGFSDGPWATVASRIVEQGVVVTIAAGNDGDEGPFYASSGSSGKEVLAVASVDTSRVPAKPWHATFTLDGVSNTTQLAYISPVNRPLWNITGLPILPLSFDTSITAEACNPLPETTPDLSNVIVLVRRGTCTPYDKQTNVEKFGAKYILFYNDDYRPFELVGNSAYASQMALIDSKAGAAIIETVKAGGNVTADFTQPADPDWTVGFFDAAGGIPSQYSSWGGTYEFEIKPDIAAPGANIYSTYLDKTWKVLSGTSMATPYVAGVAALYIGKHGGRSVHGKGFAKQLSRRIVSSGESLPWQTVEPQALPTDFGFLAPVVQVGGGLINATKLLESKTALSFEKIALNDTASFSGHHAVQITNNDDKPVTYELTLEPAGGFNAQGRTAGLLADILDVKPISLVPNVEFPTGGFSLNPGETKTADIAFSYPSVDDESRLPIYSGKILITGSNGESLSVPYLGAAFDLKLQMRGKLFPEGYPIQRSGPDGQGIDAYQTYGFNTTRVAQDFPKVQVQFKWGTKELRWDIFDASFTESKWTYPPVVGQDGYIGAATYSTYAVSSSTFDPASMDKEKVLPFPIRDIERTTSWSELTDRLWWLGKLANGSYIAPGNYTMRFAALIPFGNGSASEDWDIWKTPQITVLPYAF